MKRAFAKTLCRLFGHRYEGKIVRFCGRCLHYEIAWPARRISRSEFALIYPPGAEQQSTPESLNRLQAAILTGSVPADSLPSSADVVDLKPEKPQP